MRNAEYPAEIMAWDHEVHFEFERREAHLCASVGQETVENSGLTDPDERFMLYKRAYEQTRVELLHDLHASLARNT